MFSDPKRTKVQLKLTRGDGKTYFSSGTVYFPKYDNKFLKGDLAIVVLEKTLPNIVPLVMDLNEVSCSDSVDLFGFGLTENQNNNFFRSLFTSDPIDLQHLPMKVLENNCFQSDSIVTQKTDGTGCYVSINCKN